VVCVGRQGHHVSLVGSEVTSSSSSASPVKLKFPLVVTQSTVFSPHVASTGSGAFQMRRYMSDSSDNLRRSSDTGVGNVDQVDSSILETFDPLGYAQNTKDADGVADFDVESFAASGTDCSSLSTGGFQSVQSADSSATSLVDVSIATSTRVELAAASSSVTLTDAARDPTSSDVVDRSQSMGGERSMSSVTADSEAGERSKTAGSVPFFPPRISISHLGDGSVPSKSSPVNGAKQSSGPPSSDPVDDGCTVDRSGVGRSTAFHVVQGGLSTRLPARSATVAGTSTSSTASVIEGASGLLASRVRIIDLRFNGHKIFSVGI